MHWNNQIFYITAKKQCGDINKKKKLLYDNVVGVFELRKNLKKTKVSCLTMKHWCLSFQYITFQEFCVFYWNKNWYGKKELIDLNYFYKIARSDIHKFEITFWHFFCLLCDYEHFRVLPRCFYVYNKFTILCWFPVLCPMPTL